MRIIFICLMSFFLSSCASEAINQPNLKQAAIINTQLGYGYIEEGEPLRAKSKFQLALKQNSRSAQALAGLAFYYDKQASAVLAGRYYQRALRIAPNNPRINNNYGVFLCQQKQYRQSLIYLNRAADDLAYANRNAARQNAQMCAAKIS